MKQTRNDKGIVLYIRLFASQNWDSFRAAFRSELESKEIMLENQKKERKQQFGEESLNEESC